MSTEQPVNEEQLLESIYSQESLHYLQAIQITKTLLDVSENEEELQLCEKKLATEIEQARVLNERAMAIKETWNRTGRKPSGKLKSTIEQLTSIVETLLHNIQIVEKKMLSRKAQLLPDMDLAIQRTKMTQAYPQKQ